MDHIISALKKFPQYSGRTYRNLQVKNEQDYNDFLNEYAEGLDENDNMTAFGHEAQAVYDDIYMHNEKQSGRLPDAILRPAAFFGCCCSARLRFAAAVS